MSSAPIASAPVPRLELAAVGKSFGATRALSRVSLAVAPGEVHVLAGENGAGKSTLIKIVSGVYQDFEGELRVDGRSERFASPAEARRRGIATIHQELSLLPALSVADNFSLAERAPFFGGLDRGATRARARVALASLELELEPDVLVERLSLAERQLVEIARALDEKARVLVMDEPTSALSEPEARRLFAVVKRLREGGTSVLYISHRMDEIYELGERITVLRDGAAVLEAALSDLSRDALVSAMLGSRPAPGSGLSASRVGPRRLAVRNLSTRTSPRLLGVDFELARGEILGLAGVRGSGASEVLHALFGNVPGATGAVELDAAPLALVSPAAAFEQGVALVASDRGLSVLANLRVFENATLSSLAEWSPGLVLDERRERAAAEPELARLRVKAPSLGAPAAALSGGNQQKVALARCLLKKPRVLLLDDPTRGVDLGAKADVYALLRSLAAEGTSLLVHSSELEELVALCDRVLVLVRGRVAATLARGELETHRLLELVMGAAA
ncbi:MAG TPA: sugar ABC transporter ATP-binding protein [Polyangiaceae bacterium]